MAPGDPGAGHLSSRLILALGAFPAFFGRKNINYLDNECDRYLLSGVDAKLLGFDNGFLWQGLGAPGTVLYFCG